MKNSLQEFLPVIYPSLNGSIITEANLVQINNIARILPRVPTVSDIILECRLKCEASSVDVSIAFSRQNKHMVISYFDSLIGIMGDSLIWKKIDSFIRKWADESSFSCKNIESIWLEFDLDNKNDASPEPSLFFSLASYIVDLVEYERIAEEILSLLMGELVETKTKRCLGMCFASLPEGSGISYVGVMLPRDSESKAIRLCIKHIEITKIAKYLNSIGWVDSNGELGGILHEISAFVDSAVVSLSIENAVHPKIGIECYINKQPQFTSKWKLLFDFLLKRQLCDSEKANGLIEWPGYVEEKSCREIWPDNLSFASTFVNYSLRSAIVRTINHVKIVYQPSMPIEVKAYLWFGHRWINYDGTFQ